MVQVHRSICLLHLLVQLIIPILHVVQIVGDLLGNDVHGVVIDVDLRLDVVTVRACPAFSEQQLYIGAEVIRQVDL